MKVISMLGGLGSQMVKYAFYIAMKNQTDEDCYIDTSYFLQKKSWNGYEISKIFNQNAEDLVDYFDSELIDNIKNNRVDYRTAALKYMSNKGKVYYYFLGRKSRFFDNKINEIWRKIDHKLLMLKLCFGKQSKYPLDYATSNENAYFDEYKMNSDILFADYKDKIQEAFTFPPFNDEKNERLAEMLSHGNSVSLHVRRSDHLSDNGKLFDKQYYKKAVEFIKKKTGMPQKYCIFSDDLTWCKNNLAELGLDSSDDIIFVDWNKKENSYKDMQLMTCCQHNIIPISSFSWWGYYLSKMENKIVCAPIGCWEEVEYHF